MYTEVLKLHDYQLVGQFHFLPHVQLPLPYLARTTGTGPRTGAKLLIQATVLHQLFHHKKQLFQHSKQSELSHSYMPSGGNKSMNFYKTSHSIPVSLGFL